PLSPSRARELFLNSQCRRDADAARPDRAAWEIGRASCREGALTAAGAASPRPDRTSWLGGLRRAFSPAFRAGSLYPLARGCRRIWRGDKWLTRSAYEFLICLKSRRRLFQPPLSPSRARELFLNSQCRRDADAARPDRAAW